MSAPTTYDAADGARRLQRVAELLAEAVTPQQVLDAILNDGVRAAEVLQRLGRRRGRTRR